MTKLLKILAKDELVVTVGGDAPDDWQPGDGPLPGDVIRVACSFRMIEGPDGEQLPVVVFPPHVRWVGGVGVTLEETAT
ncbi:hypothetical protein KQI63_09745 [bacterium]|nr:hypothetical protein [bacterium]